MAEAAAAATLIFIAIAAAWWVRYRAHPEAIPMSPQARHRPKPTSRQKYLLEVADDRGVATQWFKDLGYVVVENPEAPRGYQLLAPRFSDAALDDAARCLTEIMAVAKIVATPAGPVIHIPADSHLWIAQAIESAMNTPGESVQRTGPEVR